MSTYRCSDLSLSQKRAFSHPATKVYKQSRISGTFLSQVVRYRHFFMHPSCLIQKLQVPLSVSEGSKARTQMWKGYVNFRRKKTWFDLGKIGDIRSSLGNYFRFRKRLLTLGFTEGENTFCPGETQRGCDETAVFDGPRMRKRWAIMVSFPGE